MTSLTRSALPARRWRISRRETETIQPASPRPQRRDCQGQLLAAIEAMGGPAATIDEASFRPWCSATFIGAQHRIALRIGGETAARDAATLATKLRDAEFTLHGHIVADISVDEIGEAEDGAVPIILAILTIEDW